jgi:hypothetical protein
MKFSNDAPVDVRYVNLNNGYECAMITTSEMYSGSILREREIVFDED